MKQNPNCVSFSGAKGCASCNLPAPVTPLCHIRGGLVPGDSALSGKQPAAYLNAPQGLKGDHWPLLSSLACPAPESYHLGLCR